MLAAVTRLRLRSFIFSLLFIFRSRRAARQAISSAGNRGVRLRKTRGLAYWTMTLWEGRKAMQSFRRSDAHRSAMPRLKHWCDQAAVAIWETQGEEFPNWNEGRRRLVKEGRLSRVQHPSPEHAQGQIVVD